MTWVVWIAIGLAGVAFCVWTGWPLYNIYKTRGQGADVAEGQAYFKAKARAERTGPRPARLRRPGPACRTPASPLNPIRPPGHPAAECDD